MSMLSVHNQPCSVGDAIMQITSKIAKAEPCVTDTQPLHKKLLGYLVMIINDVLPGIVGLDWLVFHDFCTL